MTVATMARHRSEGDSHGQIVPDQLHKLQRNAGSEGTDPNRCSACQSDVGVQAQRAVAVAALELCIDHGIASHILCGKCRKRRQIGKTEFKHGVLPTRVARGRFGLRLQTPLLEHRPDRAGFGASASCRLLAAD